MKKRVKKMMRFWISYLQLVELFVSSLVHLLYGFYIFSSAVAGDLSQVLNEYFQKPNLNVEVKKNVSEGDKDVKNEDLPPIVLVHGIFGFGKGVIMLCPHCFHSILCFSVKFQFLSFCFSFFINVVLLISQRLGGLSYFAGAEKKDERVLVPDLGSLTSIYDR